MSFFDEKRSFAGQIARVGGAPVATVSYINQSDEDINAGTFVVLAENGCTKPSSSDDNILGVVVACGTLHTFKSGTNLSVLAINNGDEVWVQCSDDAVLAVGDKVYAEALTGYARDFPATPPASGIAPIETNFYVSGINGSLAKIMRKGV